MDIPQQPKPTSTTTLAATTAQSIETAKAPVAIEALNLEKDKIYQAVVSQLADNKASATQTQTEKTAPSSTEWLLKLNGKLLLISSEKPLQLGQTLLVKLDASTLTLKVLTPTTLQTASLDKTNSPLSNNAAVTTALSAINQVMPRQVSLETGLTALEMFSKQNDSLQVSNQAKLILLLLSKQAPTQQSFTAAEKTNSTNTITHLLKDSGVFFESSAKQHSNNPNNLKLQIAQVQAALNMKQNTSPANTSQVPQPANTTSSIQIPSTDTTKPNTPTSAFDAIRTAILSKLQPTQQTTRQTTHQTLPQASLHTTVSNTNATQSTSPSASPLSILLNSITTPLNIPSTNIDSSSVHNDLKGLLLSITAALKADDTSSKPSGRTHIEALAQLDLLKNPFNFPHFANQSASLVSSKAESVLADQQFTTGQLLKLIAGMLNRIQFNQLNSLYQSHSNSNESNTVQSWFFELPIANPHNQLTTFEVRIDQEEDTQNQDQEHDDADAEQEVQWKLALSFNFEQLGAIYVQVTLAPPLISSTIWADRPETFELINREKPHFQSKLAELGLEVGNISCQNGQPKQDKTRLDRSLVDIKA